MPSLMGETLFGPIEKIGQRKNADPLELSRTTILRSVIEDRNADPLHLVLDTEMEPIAARAAYENEIEKVIFISVRRIETLRPYFRIEGHQLASRRDIIRNVISLLPTGIHHAHRTQADRRRPYFSDNIERPRACRFTKADERAKDAVGRVLAKDLVGRKQSGPYTISRHEISMRSIVVHGPIDAVISKYHRRRITGDGRF